MADPRQPLETRFPNATEPLYTRSPFETVRPVTITTEDATVSIADTEVAKIKDAFAALAKDPHAPRALTVELTLHIHHEYPKHVIVGKDKEGQPVIVVVRDADEEAKAKAKGVRLDEQTAPINREYPKDLIMGRDDDGNPIVKVVNSEDEEKAALSNAAYKAPVAPPAPTGKTVPKKQWP
jgi:hypothetical protein